MKNKNTILTFNEALKLFESIEKELCLDEALIQGVPWWDLIRYQLFNEILYELGLFESLTEQFKKKKFKIMNFLMKKLFNFIFIIKNLIKFYLPKSPLWMKVNSNIILSHPQRKFEQGVYIDRITDSFIDLFDNKIDFSVIEGIETNNHMSPAKTKKLFYGERLYFLANIISKFRRFKFNQNALLQISNLEKLIYDKFSCSIDVKKKVKDISKHWLGMYPLMRFFFKLKKPKLLFVVVSQSREATIAAAKSLKIPTIELQHGSPARGKLNYDYTSGIKKRSFPDFFLSYGDYWSKNCELPIDKNNIIPIGNPYLYKKINSYSHIIKEDRIVIISQGIRSLSNFALDLKKNFSKKLIVEYKPHPKEFLEKEPDYFTELRDAGVIISDEQADLYEIFARSRWLVSVYSTAIYEGLYFGTACFILNISGSEHIKKLLELDLACLISSPKEIDFERKVSKKKLENIFSKPNITNLDFLTSLTKKH